MSFDQYGVHSPDTVVGELSCLSQRTSAVRFTSQTSDNSDCSRPSIIRVLCAAVLRKCRAQPNVSFHGRYTPGSTISGVPCPYNSKLSASQWPWFWHVQALNGPQSKVRCKSLFCDCRNAYPASSNTRSGAERALSPVGAASCVSQ